MRRSLFNLVVLVAVFWVTNASALGIANRQCSNCHTMHNSQGGGVMASGGPNQGLLINDCVGCHTGTNTVSSDPYVLASGGAPTTTSLAGGNFYWVATAGGATDNKGHNVTGISGDDGTHTYVPPGGSNLAARLTCAGQTTGCHGNRTLTGEVADLSGAHHANTAGKLDTSTTIGNSYRFLKGIKGYEDPNWEFPPVTSSDHNEYYASDRSGSADSTVDTGTISYLCSRCHADFHSTASAVSSGNNMTSPWIRHPTDFDMNNVSSKPDYSGGSNTYNTTVPVGRGGAFWTGLTPPGATVMSSADDAIVTCITCHRAHGSPYASMMRWDYKAWPGTPSQDGCQQCHTTKN